MSDALTLRQVEKLEESVDEFLLRQEGSHPIDFYRQYRGDAPRFATEVLGCELTEQQAELANRLLASDTGRLAVLSANAVGKTTVAAVLVLYWLYVEGPSMVFTTAATDTQVKGQLWSEVRRWWSEAKARGYEFPGEMWTKSLVVDADANHRAFGMTARPGAYTGFHHARLLVIADECQSLEATPATDPDIQDQIWRELFRLVADRFLAIGNPSRRLGGRWHTITRDPSWHPMTLSALDHPNIREGRRVVPGAVTVETLEQWATDCGGRDSDEWRMMALGEWPASSSAAELFPFPLLDDAATRHAAVDPSSLNPKEKLTVGVDPAGTGPNMSAVVIASGTYVFPPFRWPEQGGALADRVHAYLESHFRGRKPELVVDASGGGQGLAVTEAFMQLGYKTRVVSFLGSQKPIEPEWWAGRSATDLERERRDALARYGTPMNCRAQAYLYLRDLLKQGKLLIPRDEILFEELMATGTTQGRTDAIQLEPKELIGRRLGKGRSPDSADALAFIAWRLATAEFRRAVWETPRSPCALTMPQAAQQVRGEWQLGNRRVG